MGITAQNLYDWLIDNWAGKANFRESTSDPSDTPSQRFLIHYNRDNKTIWIWNNEEWKELGNEGEEIDPSIWEQIGEWYTKLKNDKSFIKLYNDVNFITTPRDISHFFPSGTVEIIEEEGQQTHFFVDDIHLEAYGQSFTDKIRSFIHNHKYIAEDHRLYKYMPPSGGDREIERLIHITNNEYLTLDSDLLSHNITSRIIIGETTYMARFILVVIANPLQEPVCEFRYRVILHNSEGEVFNLEPGILDEDMYIVFERDKIPNINGLTKLLIEGENENILNIRTPEKNMFNIDGVEDSINFRSPVNFRTIEPPVFLNLDQTTFISSIDSIISHISIDDIIFSTRLNRFFDKFSPLSGNIDWIYDKGISNPIWKIEKEVETYTEELETPINFNVEIDEANYLAQIYGIEVERQKGFSSFRYDDFEFGLFRLKRRGDFIYMTDSQPGISKFGLDGSFMWRNTFSGSQGWGLDIDSDGNIYITSGSGNTVIKYDEDGNILNTFDGIEFNSTQITLYEELGFAITACWDGYVYKLDMNDLSLIKKEFLEYDLEDIVIDKENNFIYILNLNGIIFKLDLDLNIIWQENNTPPEFSDWVFTLSLSPDNNFLYFGGETNLLFKVSTSDGSLVDSAEIFQVEDTSSGLEQIIFDDEDNILLGTSDRYLYRIDYDMNISLKLLTETKICGMDFLEKGSSVIIGGHDAEGWASGGIYEFINYLNYSTNIYNSLDIKAMFYNEDGELVVFEDEEKGQSIFKPLLEEYSSNINVFDKDNNLLFHTDSVNNKFLTNYEYIPKENDSIVDKKYIDSVNLWEPDEEDNTIKIKDNKEINLYIDINLKFKEEPLFLGSDTMHIFEKHDDAFYIKAEGVESISHLFGGYDEMQYICDKYSYLDDDPNWEIYVEEENKYYIKLNPENNDYLVSTESPIFHKFRLYKEWQAETYDDFFIKIFHIELSPTSWNPAWVDFLIKGIIYDKNGDVVDNLDGYHSTNDLFSPTFFVFEGIKSKIKDIDYNDLINKPSPIVENKNNDDYHTIGYFVDNTDFKTIRLDSTIIDNENIQYVTYCTNGKIVYKKNDNLYCFNTNSKKEELLDNDVSINSITYIGNNNILYGGIHGLKKYNFLTKEITNIGTLNNEHFAYMGNNKIIVFNAPDLNIRDITDIENISKTLVKASPEDGGYIYLVKYLGDNKFLTYRDNLESEYEHPQQWVLGNTTRKELSIDDDLKKIFPDNLTGIFPVESIGNRKLLYAKNNELWIKNIYTKSYGFLLQTFSSNINDICYIGNNLVYVVIGGTIYLYQLINVEDEDNHVFEYTSTDVTYGVRTGEHRKYLKTPIHMFCGDLNGPFYTKVYKNGELLDYNDEWTWGNRVLASINAASLRANIELLTNITDNDIFTIVYHEPKSDYFANYKHGRNDGEHVDNRYLSRFVNFGGSVDIKRIENFETVDALNREYSIKYEDKSPRTLHTSTIAWCSNFEPESIMNEWYLEVWKCNSNNGYKRNLHHTNQRNTVGTSNIPILISDENKWNLPGIRGNGYPLGNSTNSNKGQFIFRLRNKFTNEVTEFSKERLIMKMITIKRTTTVNNGEYLGKYILPKFI